MDLPTLWTSFVSTSSPLPPDGTVVRWVLPLFWGVVLAFAALYWSRSLRQPRGKWMALIIIAWMFVPGVWSPAYWLGLAFQLPSLTSVGLCAMALAGRGCRNVREPLAHGTSPIHWLGILLGLVLLLDTFLIVPFPLYRWGNSPAVLGFLSVVAATLWALGGERARRSAALLLVVLALFVMTRLPSGNVFDAVIDPWLWFALLFKALKNWRAGRQAARP